MIRNQFENVSKAVDARKAVQCAKSDLYIHAVCVRNRYNCNVSRAQQVVVILNEHATNKVLESYLVRIYILTTVANEGEPRLTTSPSPNFCSEE